MKKKVIAFIPSDHTGLPMAHELINSIRKFHSEDELPIKIVDNPNKDDVDFWYRATPVIAKDLIKEYDLVIKLDNDQICFGDLSHILTSPYDVGTVLNINRVDPPYYGLVQFQGVAANEYYNNGLVAMRSEAFVNEWYRLCFSKYFMRLQYREQDILNILTHYGNYQVKCFDNYTDKDNYWNGLVAKGETIHASLKDGKVIIPKGKDNYPDRDTILKMWHTAGGKSETKRNYRIAFSEELISYISWLISDTTKPYES